MAKPAGIGKLRVAVKDYLVDHRVDTECIFDSLLVVSELASHAMHEGGEPIRARVQCSDSDKHVWIDVFDTASTPSQAGSEDGWVLGLVAKLSDSWGIVQARHGKTVWASLKEDA